MAYECLDPQVHRVFNRMLYKSECLDQEVPGGQRVLNLLDTFKGAGVKAKDLPTLYKNPVFNKMLEKDPNPKYVGQRMEYPIKGTGGIYTEEFFESFLNRIVESPIPGSKDGHHIYTGKRPPTDFFLIGGRLDKNGDGTGVVWFKNYIPPRGSTEDNVRFMEEVEMNMIHFSLVTVPKIIIEGEDENGDYVRYIVQSLRGERNDAVEVKMGAMEQEVNQIEQTTAVGDSKKSKEKNMDKKELLQAVKNMFGNGNLSLEEFANSTGVGDRIATANDLEMRKTAEGLTALGVTDAVAEINALRTGVKQNSDVVFDAKLDKAFGSYAVTNNGVVENTMRDYALSVIKRNEDFDVQVEALKNTAIAKKLAGLTADANNGVNVVESKEASEFKFDANKYRAK